MIYNNNRSGISPTDYCYIKPSFRAKRSAAWESTAVINLFVDISPCRILRCNQIYLFITAPTFYLLFPVDCQLHCRMIFDKQQFRQIITSGEPAESVIPMLHNALCYIGGNSGIQNAFILIAEYIYARSFHIQS